MDPNPLEAAIKASLEAIDRANAAVEKERKKLERELEAARRARAKAEKQGDKIAEEYFAKARVALIEFTRKEQLRQLARGHLEKGRSIEDICLWLGVEPEFVQAIVDVMDRRIDYLREVASQNRIRLDGNPRLRYQNQGRSGTIWFESDRAKFDMWWEFGTGDTFLFIGVPSPREWKAKTGSEREERDAILRFVAEEVLASEFSNPNRRFEIGDSYVTIFR